jgi:peptide/nickel transport system ATP-binding protein
MLQGVYGDPTADEVELEDIPGAPPDLSLEEPGCAVVPRCAVAASVCSEMTPRLEPLRDGRAACHARAPSLLVGGTRSAS